MEKALSVGEAEYKAKEYLSNEEYDELDELFKRVMNQEQFLGSANDFHNFSLNFSRKDDYKSACDILEIGLQQYPLSVDLLADYLQVGVNCNRLDRCQACYDSLLRIPKIRWTWRGFSFIIDYMLFIAGNTEMSEDELICWKEKMLNLTDEYAKFFPYNENPYVCKADIHSFYNDQEEVMSTLNHAVKAIKVCPKCELRLADMLFDSGDYDRSLEIVTKCIYGSVQTQDSINQSYMYYLSGLCKVVRVLKLNAFSDANSVVDIYSDFSIAENSGLSQASYKKVIDRNIRMLETKSGIEYDDAVIKSFNMNAANNDDAANKSFSTNAATKVLQAPNQA